MYRADAPQAGTWCVCVLLEGVSLRSCRFPRSQPKPARVERVSHDERTWNFRIHSLGGGRFPASYTSSLVAHSCTATSSLGGWLCSMNRETSFPARPAVFGSLFDVANTRRKFEVLPSHGTLNCRCAEGENQQLSVIMCESKREPAARYGDCASDTQMVCLATER